MRNIKLFLSNKPWIISTVIFGVLVFLGSLAHPLWGDEAETAFFAKTILKTGLPMGWDGVNMTAINDGILLNKNLVNHTDPWPAQYIAAISFAIFGQSAFSARLPFSILSLLCIPLIYLISFKISKNKTQSFLTSLLLSLSVPFILFSFQARYYILTVVGGLLLFYSSFFLSERKIWPKITFVFAGILYIYSHYVSFSAFYFSIFGAFIVHYLIKKEDLKSFFSFILQYIFYGVLILLAFLPWFLIYKPLDERGAAVVFSFNKIIQVFPVAVRIITEHINLSAVFPTIFWPFLIIILLFNYFKHKALSSLVLCILPSVFYIAIICFMNSIVSTADTNPLAVRYNVIVYPLLILAVSVFFNHVGKIGKWIMYLLVFTYITTNLFTFETQRSYLLDYISEITNPYPSSDQLVADYLFKHANNGDTACVNSMRAIEPLIFLLDDKIRFVNRVNPNNRKFFPQNHKILPKYIYSFLGKPDWVILYSTHIKNDSLFDFDLTLRCIITPGLNLDTDYEKEIIPVFYGSDASRPEIERHQFKKIEPKYDEQVFIFHKKDTKN